MLTSLGELLVDHEFYRLGDQPRLPEHVGRFLILDRNSTAVGSQSEVYRAAEPTSGSIVAVKVNRNFLESYSQSIFSALLGEVDASDIRHEAEVLQRIDHPNVVRFLEVDEDLEYGPYLVMEWIPFGDLRGLLNEIPSGILKTDAALMVVRGILEGLEATHGVGISHMDINPSNILTSSDLGIKLVDFGSSITKDGRESYALGKGTDGYMIPDQESIPHKDLGLATDLYSVGVMFHEMLFGYLPVVENRRIITDEKLTGLAKSFIDGCTDPDTYKRFSSISEALIALTS